MSKKQSCLIIAGEKSGEDHAMTFFSELKKRLPRCEFYGVGGSRLEEQGVELLYHLKDFSGIGISEILSKIPFYYKALDQILQKVDRMETKTAILIDFQGFNLKLAQKLKKRGVNVLYYVAPQAWVWKPWRAKVLQKNVHTLFTILPFEKQWFLDRGVSKIKSVVHPLMIEHANKLKSIRTRSAIDFKDRPVKLLLLPGSRNVEVSKLLPIFIEGMKILQEEGYRFDLGIVKSESVREEHYENIDTIQSWHSSELAHAMEWADMSLAASGTVTLASGLFQLPTVVCYQVSLFTEFILGLALTYKGPISLTNIICEKMIFPELVQYRADRYNISKHLRAWLTSDSLYNETVESLSEVQTKLTGDDFNTADYMCEVIEINK